jgi:hypothetical protein
MRGIGLGAAVLAVLGAHCDAFTIGLHQQRVACDRAGAGHEELIVLLSTILDPEAARADELAVAYNERWEQETAHDQLKTHLRGPGRILRSRLPDLVRQEIWAWLTVHYAISVLIARAAQAVDKDPDRVSYARALRIIRRGAEGAAAFPP